MSGAAVPTVGYSAAFLKLRQGPPDSSVRTFAFNCDQGGGWPSDPCFQIDVVEQDAPDRHRGRAQLPVCCDHEHGMLFIDPGDSPDGTTPTINRANHNDHQRARCENGAGTYCAEFVRIGPHIRVPFRTEPSLGLNGRLQKTQEWRGKMVPPGGIEPPAPPLPRVCSTPELRRHVVGTWSVRAGYAIGFSGAAIAIVSLSPCHRPAWLMQYGV